MKKRDTPEKTKLAAAVRERDEAAAFQRATADILASGGRVDVSAKLDTDKVEIAVRDTGLGISAEDQPKLFEEFRQVGSDAARKAEGTGLGLALTKKFVELHGGEIRVSSAPGMGATFTCLLPIRS